MSVTNPTEVEKLQAFLDAERRNGLVDFKFTTKSMLEAVDGSLHPDDHAGWLKRVQEAHQKAGVTAESLAKELNEMLAAPTIPDPELF